MVISGGRIGGSDFGNFGKSGSDPKALIAPLVIAGGKHVYNKYQENEQRKAKEREEKERRDSRPKSNVKLEYSFQPFKFLDKSNNNNNNMNKGKYDKTVSKSVNIGGSGGKGRRGGGGYNKSNGFSDSRGTNVQALSQAPRLYDEPSGILSGTLVSDIQRTRESYKSLAILTGWLTPAGNYTPGSNLEKFITDIVYPSWLNSVKTHLNFETTITLDEFKTAMSSIIKGLNQYYCIDSVLKYCDGDNNFNIAMNLIRNKFDSNILRLNRNLGDTLARYVIPPEIIKLIMWLNGNYTTGMNPTSNMIKTSYGNTIVYGSNGFITKDLLQGTIDGLNNESVLNTLSKMERAMPNWRVSELPMMDASPKYDPNFINFWMNQPQIIYTTDTDFKYYPNAKDFNKESKVYSLINNRHDGLVYALSTIFSDGTGNPEPGLWFNYFDSSENFINRTNKWVFNNNNDGFESFQLYGQTDKSFPLTHFAWKETVAGNPYYYYDSAVPYGCQQIQEHSAANTLSALYKSVEMLYDTRSLR